MSATIATFTTTPMRQTNSTVRAAASTRPALRITRRGRIVLAVVLAVPALLVSASIALSSMPAAASNESATVDFEYVTVQAGESLWSVAERVAPASDPRDVIADIERLNGLESSAVAAGQSVAIPVSYLN
jgi:LysM repeat protein